MNHHLRTLFLLFAALLFLPYANSAANENEGRGTYVPSLESTNKDYMHDFCAYHAASPICIIKPNPPPRPPATVPPSPIDNGPSGPPPPPPAECTTSTATANVTPSSFSSAIASLGAGRTIVLAPGSYPGLNINGKSMGGATIKCAQSGKCTLRNSKINRSRDLTIEGIVINGGGIGIDIDESQNITVRCSVFNEQSSSGVLINPGKTNDQIMIDKNVFHNESTGCTIGGVNCSGQLSDGSVVANMDYGVRVYDAKNVYIRGNIFSSVFNHGISLKAGVRNTLIEENTFNSCGRTCINLGQEPNTVPKGYISCGQAIVKNNRFSGKALSGLFISNIEKVIMSGNTNTVSGRKVYIQPAFKKCTTQTGGCPLLGNGQPANRQIIGN